VIVNIEKPDDTSKFEFKFETQGNEIDAITLIETLASLDELFSTVSKECYSNVNCKLAVSAHKPGSFIIDLSAIVMSVAPLITPTNISSAYSIIGMVKNCFDIKKHIGNKKPTRVEKRESGLNVTNSDGLVKTYSNEMEKFFESPKIEATTVNIINNRQQQYRN